TKRLYALAAGMGMVERNNKDDPFHQLVAGITDKTSVSELTDSEAKAVEHELLERIRLGKQNKPLKRKKTKTKSTVPGMMSEQQQKLAWRLVYRLCELEPTEATASKRLIGAIQKVLGVTASTKDPFRWINFEDGVKLIESLKRYVRSAERRAAKKAGAG
ncbi:MAG: DUF1018 domain-containing protein, partial [Ruminococcus sp.]|nr:DUF1018 domain-containing protein [Ruminococcus sp.]